MRRLSSWHVSRLHATYARTSSIAESARAAGVSLPTAYRVLAKVHAPAVPVFKTGIRKEAQRLYETGLSCRAVAEELAKVHSPAPSQESIHQWMRNAGVLRTKSRAMELREAKKHGKDYDRIRQQARRLVIEEALCEKSAAKILGVGRKVVERALPEDERVTDPSEAMLRRKWQSNLPDVEQRRAIRDEVIARRERGETLDQIVAATGKSKATVSKYIRDAGLSRPTKRRANLQNVDAEEVAA